MKTSVVLGQNIRTFAQRSPMFSIFRNVFVKREQSQACLSYAERRKWRMKSNVRTLSYKKSFAEISYISYTTAWDALYLLEISGEG